MAVPSDLTPFSFPEETLLRFLEPLQPVATHASVSRVCRLFYEISKDDRLWAARLRRDFPLTSLNKPAGLLHKVYRIVANSQLGMTAGIGPAAVFGAIDGMDLPTGDEDGLEIGQQRSTVTLMEIRDRAAHSVSSIGTYAAALHVKATELTGSQSSEQLLELMHELPSWMQSGHVHLAEQVISASKDDDGDKDDVMMTTSSVMMTTNAMMILSLFLVLLAPHYHSTRSTPAILVELVFFH